jgi:hypothetical protein
LLEHREGFVARSEVKDAAFSEVPDGTRAEAFAFIPTLLKDHGVGFRHMKGFAVHLSLANVPREWEAFGNGMVWKKGGDVSGCSVCAVGWKNATGEGECPTTRVSFFEERGYAISGFRDATPRPIIEEFECHGSAFVCRKHLQSVLFGPLLHDADEGFAPMR